MCHRPVTTLQQPACIMLSSHDVTEGTCGRSRRSAGGARLRWSGLATRARRKASWASSTGWHAEGRVVHRMPPAGVRGRWRVRRTGPFGRASASSGRCPATIGSRPVRGRCPVESGRADALTVRRASARVTHPSERPPLALRQPKETLRRRNSSGTVLRATRHQHRQDRCVPGRSLKTE